MDPFAPDHLSPLPRRVRPVPLPYGLTWEDLCSILPGLDPHETSRARALPAFEKQGLNGGANSCILRLQYPAGKKRLRSLAVFIKQSRDPLSAEAARYAYLSRQAVPTPRVLAVFEKNGAEVILLEFLPRIGIDFQSSAEVEALLRLIAAINAVEDPPACFSPTPTLPDGKFDALLQEALARALSQPAWARIDPQHWLAAYRLAQQACSGMPLALNHNQMAFQQVGWAGRAARRRLVVFDLETMFPSERFADIANVLRSLAISSGHSQPDLFQLYLDALRGFSGAALDPREAFAELRWLRILQSFQSLPWLVTMMDGPDPEPHEWLAADLACIEEDIEALRL